MSDASTPVFLSRVHYPVTTLGPGRRIGIWFQGCSIHCAGCISADTWAPTVGGTTVDDVVSSLLPFRAECDGVTISGGEPFEQPEALLELLRQLARYGFGDMLVYSGHPLERLAPFLSAAAGLIDAVITDPYEQYAPQTRALRGSDNQRLTCLTARGRLRFPAYDEPAASNPVLDVMFDDDGTVWFAGIPRRDDFRRLRRDLAAEGHDLQMTQATARERGGSA